MCWTKFTVASEQTWPNRYREEGAKLSPKEMSFPISWIWPYNSQQSHLVLKLWKGMHLRPSGCHELLGNGSENVDIDSEHELTSSPRYCKFVSGFGKPEIASIFADSVPERIGRKIPANCQLKQKSNSPHYWRNRHADNEACKERNPVKLFTIPFELPKNSREGWKRQSIFDRGVASAPSSRATIGSIGV